MRSFQKYQFEEQSLLWGLLHGINDFVAGYMLAKFTLDHDYSSSSAMLIIYSILGFGGQLPLGLLLDRLKTIKIFAQVSVFLLMVSIAFYFIDPVAAIIITGFAGAGVHVTGGAICLVTSNDKSSPLGIFTAPGVFGLTLGGILGSLSSSLLLIPFAATVFLAFLILRSVPVYQIKKLKAPSLDTHDWIMMGILLVMCFRSLVFDIMNVATVHFENGAMIIGISAFAGKIIGGFAADKIGWKKFVYITLPIAFILLQFGKENIYALAFGIACLQSSVPITLFLMGQSFRLFPATASALSLGTSVAVAGIPLYFLNSHPGNNFTNYALVIFAIAGILVTLFFIRRTVISVDY